MARQTVQNRTPLCRQMLLTLAVVSPMHEHRIASQDMDQSQEAVHKLLLGNSEREQAVLSDRLQALYTYYSVWTRYWVTTSKHTTKQHPLLDNRFLVNKNTEVDFFFN
jgi:hypothetical protein